MIHFTMASAKQSSQRPQEDMNDAQFLPSNLFCFDQATVDRSVHILNSELLGHRAIVIGNLFDDEECDKLVQFIDGRDPTIATDNAEGLNLMVPANSKREYRNCLRLCARNQEVADEIHRRVLPILSCLGEQDKLCSPANAAEFLQGGLGMKGMWRVDSVNPFFRLCKYHEEGHFGPHSDADYIVDPFTHRSLKTLMIYLNDSYDGGETHFCHSHDMHFDEAHRIYCAPAESIHTSWKPRKGDCILFDHPLLHEGARVRNGEKYIMRSEVMYRKDAVAPENEDSIQEEKAIRLWYEGCSLEEQGQVDAAIRLYRQAYKLLPALESHFT